VSEWRLSGSALVFIPGLEDRKAFIRDISSFFNSIARTGLSKRMILEEPSGMKDIDTPDSVFIFIYDRFKHRAAKNFKCCFEIFEAVLEINL